MSNSPETQAPSAFRQYLKGTDHVPPTDTAVHRASRTLQAAAELQATIELECDQQGTLHCNLTLKSGIILTMSIDQKGNVQGTTHSAQPELKGAAQ